MPYMYRKFGKPMLILHCHRDKSCLNLRLQRRPTVRLQRNLHRLPRDLRNLLQHQHQRLPHLRQRHLPPGLRLSQGAAFFCVRSNGRCLLPLWRRWCWSELHLRPCCVRDRPLHSQRLRPHLHPALHRRRRVPDELGLSDALHRRWPLRSGLSASCTSGRLSPLFSSAETRALHSP